MQTVRLSQKLDLLQAMARQYANNANALYLIGILADHVEEEEETDIFLEKMKMALPHLSR